MNDVRGDTLKVGDSVYIYFGYNELKPGIVKEIRRLRDEAPSNKEGLPTKQLCQHLLNYWDRKRPCNLVCS